MIDENTIFADRMNDVPKSFIRELLKAAVSPEIISFGGGLPNRELFPVEEIKEAAIKVLDDDGKSALQYSTSEGYLPLREYIAERYSKQRNLALKAENILITNGSQQALDLIAKTLINENDNVLIEKPGYLGAIQLFSLYKARFHTVPLEDDGADLERLEEVLANNKIRLFYSVPNFQNPAGITYSNEKRQKTAELVKKYSTFFVEDDPYGELRFMGEHKPALSSYLDNEGIVLGSFSKIFAPGFRLGWVHAENPLADKLVVAKQASDLHSNFFAQRVVYQYLMNNDIDAHIERIKAAYRSQREKMVAMIEEHFPAGVKYTKPEGGMFLWISLPEQVKAMDLFERAIKENVAFVPGTPFYTNGELETNTLRLNFSNVDEATIEEGMIRLAKAIKSIMS